MTREEEIEILQAAFMKLDRMVKWYHGIVHGLAIRENDIKALEVAKIAIEALQTQIKESLEIFNNGAEPESMLNADLISRQAAISVANSFDATQVVRGLEKLPFVQPESCGMTAEEYRQRMIQAFQNSDCDELIALVCLPDAKEFENLEWLLKTHYKKEPCKSCISKESVLQIFDDMTKEYVKTQDFDRASGIAWVSVQRLPSVQPEQKEITTEDVIAYCRQRNLIVVTNELFDKMINTADEVYLYLKDKEGE